MFEPSKSSSLTAQNRVHSQALRQPTNARFSSRWFLLSAAEGRPAGSFDLRFLHGFSHARPERRLFLPRTNAVGVPQVSQARKGWDPLPRFVLLTACAVSPAQNFASQSRLRAVRKLNSELSVWYYPPCPSCQQTKSLRRKHRGRLAP